MMAAAIPQPQALNPDPAVIENLRNKATASKLASPPRHETLLDVDPDLAADCVEVADMDRVEVVTRISELSTALEAFINDPRVIDFHIPSRSKYNHLYVPQLSRFVLWNSPENKHARYLTPNFTRKAKRMIRIIEFILEAIFENVFLNKRELFYKDVDLFGSERNTDEILHDICCTVRCTRISLHVIADSRGVVIGHLTFTQEGEFVDCCHVGPEGRLIPQRLNTVENMQCGDSLFILVIEKETAFSRLVFDRFYEAYPCILITSHGQGDIATKRFLKRMKMDLRLPVLALMDADPHGLSILCTYRFGSKRLSYDSASLATPDIRWLGLRPTDLDLFKIPSASRLGMTTLGKTIASNLLEEEFMKADGNEKWGEELQLMIGNQETAEIEALSRFGNRFLTKEYLPSKLLREDWL